MSSQQNETPLTYVFRARIGAELRKGASPAPPLLAEPMFGPGTNGVQDGPLPAELGRYFWLTGTLEQVLADPAVVRAWREAPPCPPLATEVATGPSDAETRLATARAALHRLGTGVGVKIAIVERAWSDAVAGLPLVTAERLPKGLDPAFAQHGDQTVATIRGAGTVAGLAPGAALGLFTAVATTPGGMAYDDVAGAIARAVAWLGPPPTGLRGCIAAWLGPVLRYLSWIPGFAAWVAPNQGILLVELQHLLGVHQVDDLTPEDKDYRCPGGWVAAGPVDADPGVARGLAYAASAGHLVVLPAGNGRRDLSRVSDDAGTGRLTGAHAGVRVGACDKDGRMPASNFTDRAVDLAAPGWSVPTAAVTAGTWTEARWSGTSPAAAIVAAVAACLRSSGRTTDGVEVDLRAGGRVIPSLGVRPRWFG